MASSSAQPPVEDAPAPTYLTYAFDHEVGANPDPKPGVVATPVSAAKVEPRPIRMNATDYTLLMAMITFSVIVAIWLIGGALNGVFPR